MNIFQYDGVTAKILLIHFADKYNRIDCQALVSQITGKWLLGA